MLKNRQSNYYHFKKNNSSQEPRKYEKKKICCTNGVHKNIIIEEFLCHLPMAILALSVSLFLVTSFNEFILLLGIAKVYSFFYLNLFHIAHYIHILCASFSSFYSCYNTQQKHVKSKHIIFYIFFALLNSIVFCTISDMILPALGSLFFENNITIHICLFCKTDFLNALLFSFFGILAGFCLTRGDKEYSYRIAKKVHIGHIWFGCIASILYLFSQVSINTIMYASPLFIILFIAVLLPCIISDVCLPFLITRYTQKKFIMQHAH